MLNQPDEFFDFVPDKIFAPEHYSNENLFIGRSGDFDLQFVINKSISRDEEILKRFLDKKIILTKTSTQLVVKIGDSYYTLTPIKSEKVLNIKQTPDNVRVLVKNEIYIEEIRDLEIDIEKKTIYSEPYNNINDIETQDLKILLILCLMNIFFVFSRRKNLKKKCLKSKLKNILKN